MMYITNQPVEGKCIQPSELHYTAVPQIKEETPIMGEFSPTTYAKEVCYVKLVGEFSPTKYAVKVLLLESHG